MKTLFFKKMPIWGLLLFLVWAIGCEETLEVCASCGLVSTGDVTISGDPRIDGTFEAVYHYKTKADKFTNMFEQQLAKLSLEYGFEPPDSWQLDSVNELKARIVSELFNIDGVNVLVSVIPPSCYVDSQKALSRSLFCEAANECYVSSSCKTRDLGSCTGLCEGSCSSGCMAGSHMGCFQSTGGIGDVNCGGRCIGTCDTAVPQFCPGDCMGSCSDVCSSYDATGQCNGYCFGLCDGICTHDSPFACEEQGICAGYCDGLVVDFVCEQGLCHSNCANGNCTGQCRGHFRPKVCDTTASCEAGSECQEMAKGLAWAYLSCTPPKVEVTVSFAEDFAGSQQKILYRANQLESALSQFAAAAGPLSLWLYGEDQTGLSTPDDYIECTDETSCPYDSLVLDPDELTDFGVVFHQKHLPLFDLKARLGMLSQTAVAGKYLIAAGPLACVVPAITDAKVIIDALVPTRDANAEQSDTPADGGVSELEADLDHGLFKLLGNLNSFLNLANEPASE